MSSNLQNCQTFMEKLGDGKIRIYAIVEKQMYIIITDEDAAKVVFTKHPENQDVKLVQLNGTSVKLNFKNSDGNMVTIDTTASVASMSADVHSS